MEPLEPFDGATPLDDISGLRSKTIRTRGQLYAAEAENMRTAYVKYLSSRPATRLAPFDVAWLKKLHREMFGKVWKWAGTARSHDVNIGVGWTRIDAELLDLEQTVDFFRSSPMPLIEQATRLHHRSVAIHPFPNGNGRWGRLLANIWLKHNGAEPTAWPERLNAENDVRNEYLIAMREADAGDIEHLLDIHRRYTPESHRS